MTKPSNQSLNNRSLPPLHVDKPEENASLLTPDVIMRQKNTEVIHTQSDKIHTYQPNNDAILAKDILDAQKKPYTQQGKTVSKADLSSKDTAKHSGKASSIPEAAQSSFSARLKQARELYNHPSATISTPYSNGPKIR